MMFRLEISVADMVNAEIHYLFERFYACIFFLITHNLMNLVPTESPCLTVLLLNFGTVKNNFQVLAIKRQKKVLKLVNPLSQIIKFRYTILVALESVS